MLTEESRHLEVQPGVETRYAIIRAFNLPSTPSRRIALHRIAPTSSRASTIPLVAHPSHPAKKWYYTPLSRPFNHKANPLPPCPGRQAPHPARTRAPPGKVHRHRAPGHDELGVADQHPARHVLFHRRSPAAPLVHCARRERARRQGPRPDDPGMSPFPHQMGG